MKTTLNEIWNVSSLSQIRKPSSKITGDYKAKWCFILNQFKDLISLCILAMNYTIFWFVLSMKLENFNKTFFKYHPSHSIRASGTASAAFTSGSAINSLLCLLTWLQMNFRGLFWRASEGSEVVFGIYMSVRSL